MRPSRPVLQWWLRPSVWLWVGAGALVVGAGFAFYTEFWMLLAAAPVFVAVGIAAWVAIVVRVHRRARDGAGRRGRHELDEIGPRSRSTTFESRRTLSSTSRKPAPSA